MLGTNVYSNFKLASYKCSTLTLLYLPVQWLPGIDMATTSDNKLMASRPLSKRLCCPSIFFAHRLCRIWRNCFTNKLRMVSYQLGSACEIAIRTSTSLPNTPRKLCITLRCSGWLSNNVRANSNGVYNAVHSLTISWRNIFFILCMSNIDQPQQPIFLVCACVHFFIIIIFMLDSDIASSITLFKRSVGILTLGSYHKPGFIVIHL